MAAVHTPVLLNEALALLQLQPGDCVIDATLGDGGHALEILKQTAPDGILIGIDRDQIAIDRSTKRLKSFGRRFIARRGSFSMIEQIVSQTVIKKSIRAVLLDIGLSSVQIDDHSRGFSFTDDDALLDMRMSGEGKTAANLLNTQSHQQLTDILSGYGGEQFAGPIAAEIVSLRQKQKLSTVQQLTSAVLRVYRQKKPNALHGRRHPATKTFQAIRIAVNDELHELEKALPKSIDLLESGGRLAVITFHSLEHRIVKNHFTLESKDCICPPKFPVCRCNHRARLTIITKRSVKPSEDEIKNNPRARSAQLRVAEKQHIK